MIHFLGSLVYWWAWLIWFLVRLDWWLLHQQWFLVAGLSYDAVRFTVWPQLYRVWWMRTGLGQADE